MTKIDGRKARIIDNGKWFDTYRDFAIKHGYPDAAAKAYGDRRKTPQNGDIVTLLISGNHEYDCYDYPLWIVEMANGDRHIIGEIGLQILDSELYEDRISELERQVEGLTGTVAKMAIQLRVAREDIVLIEEGVADIRSKLEPKPVTIPKLTKSAPPSREDVVKRAIADVATLKRLYFGDSCRVEFVVHRKKRTVVALRYYLGKVITRGIAKAAPGDCFNVYIGKAIALRRALGLVVPDEYTNAPQPEGVRVGDVVEHTYLTDGPVTVTRELNDGGAGFDSFINEEGDEVCGYAPGYFNIIDDSARYGYDSTGEGVAA